MPAHGIMFHHFHDGQRHPAGEGSLSAEQLAGLIELLGRERILPAREWVERATRRALRESDLCLTFDDTLRCQWNVAAPVLREFGLTAAWFITTGALRGQGPRLEIDRRFRLTRFGSVEDFYAAFFRLLGDGPEAEAVQRALEGFDPASYLAGFPFYSEADRRFRFVRDEALGPRRYARLMDALIRATGDDPAELARGAWLTSEQVVALHAEGHVLGLHTHTHPTRVAQLPAAEQLREYRDNLMALWQWTGERPRVMAHPCNSYSAATLDLLRGLGVRIGFRSNLALREHSELEFPREDHANLLRETRRCASRSSQATSLATSR